ncbi:hypothetical protein [Spirosoma fluviale]|nr:hypothetical protein [Spirosoma fluviale]
MKTMPPFAPSLSVNVKKAARLSAQSAKSNKNLSWPTTATMFGK